MAEPSTIAKPQATIVITTRNRCEELENALASCFQQDVPLDVLVMDDASTDGTAEMVRSKFPQARLERAEKQTGYIVQRNLAATLAKAPFIVSIDDDAIFTSKDTVRRALEEFDDETVAAVAIPFVNVRESDVVQQSAPNADGKYVAGWFIGTAHAIRRKTFEELGGYRGFFFSQTEELDYSVRLISAGYLIRVGNSEPIHHFQSPKRDRWEIIYFGERNKVLLACLNFPLRSLPRDLAGLGWRAMKRTLKGPFRSAWMLGHMRGYFSALRHIGKRKAMKVRAFKAYRAASLIGAMLQDEFLTLRR